MNVYFLGTAQGPWPDELKPDPAAIVAQNLGGRTQPAQQKLELLAIIGRHTPARPVPCSAQTSQLARQLQRRQSSDAFLPGHLVLAILDRKAPGTRMDFGLCKQVAHVLHTVFGGKSCAASSIEKINARKAVALGVFDGFRQGGAHPDDAGVKVRKHRVATLSYPKREWEW